MHIDHLRVSDLPRIQPLWLDLHAHHQAVGPHLRPYVDDQNSWVARRGQYEELFSKGGGIIVAREGETDLGYAAWSPQRMPWPACFGPPYQLAELVTLAVRPSHQGRGIGKSLLGELAPMITRAGFTTEMVGVVPTNTAAIVLYQQRGFLPTWLILSRFGRPMPLTSEPMPLPEGLAIETVRLEDVEALKPFWVGVHHVHRAVASELEPFVTDNESWNVYARTVRESAKLGLVWRLGPKEKPLAMACASILKDSSTFADTWATSGPVAEIEILAVDPSLRDRGIGTAMMQVMDRHLMSLDVADQIVGAVSGNVNAIRLYERLDYRPTWLQLTRFPGRNAA